MLWRVPEWSSSLSRMGHTITMLYLLAIWGGIQWTHSRVAGNIHTSWQVLMVGPVSVDSASSVQGSFSLVQKKKGLAEGEEGRP